KDIKLIKIDVEGSEINVLRGSIKVINKFHPLVFLELNKPVLESTGSSVQEVSNFLLSKGYKCFRLIRGRLR
ncbi:FkbM family methyltransferase, partial [Candidatus Daviesbacteria bacterium]|nr:FkbM family methyltransferase [Candidatus Daviesbacteria bacterium]